MFEIEMVIKKIDKDFEEIKEKIMNNYCKTAKENIDKFEMTRKAFLKIIALYMYLTTKVMTEDEDEDLEEIWEEEVIFLLEDFSPYENKDVEQIMHYTEECEEIYLQNKYLFDEKYVRKMLDEIKNCFY